MEYAGDEGNVRYAGEGPGGFSQQGDRTTVEGGDSHFVVEYVYDQQADAASRSADVDVKGGNNAFVIHVDGSAGGSDIVVEGGNNQFAIVFDNATGGNNTVYVDGGNNQFVVRFNYNDGIGEGDIVTVNGANNQYIVETTSGGDAATNSVAAAGPGGGFGTLPGGQDAASTNGGSYDYSAFGAAAAGGQTGAGYDYSALGGNAEGQGSNPAGGGAPAAGGTGGGPVGGGEGAAPADLDALIAQSPFGRLLDLPGINGAQDIFGNVSGNFSGENPFAATGAAPGSNPFANYGGQTNLSATGGGTSASGGAAPAAGSAYDFSAVAQDAENGGNGGGNPLAAGGTEGSAAVGGDTASLFASFAGGGQSSDANYDFGAFQGSGGDDAAAAFAASPFGALIGLPGIDGPEDIFGDEAAASFAAATGNAGDSDAGSGADAASASVPGSETAPIA